MCEKYVNETGKDYLNNSFYSSCPVLIGIDLR